MAGVPPFKSLAYTARLFRFYLLHFRAIQYPDFCTYTQVASVTRSRRASCLGSHASLTIFDLEPLDLQIVASPSNQVILAEPSISRLLGYTWTSFILW
ncbi:hypothetical protein BG259_00720 [Vibrio harveyi]|nr:hypothetical protein BG259_00720 [Vibrio harveyi]